MAAATDPAPLFDLRGRRVFVAGHRGMVGSAIVRRLAGVDCEVVTVGHDRLDLLRQDDTAAYLRAAKPDAVIVAAAKVGGIAANNASGMCCQWIRSELIAWAQCISPQTLASGLCWRNIW